MTSHSTSGEPRARRWLWFAFVAVLIAVALPGLSDTARRNRANLHFLHGDAMAAPAGRPTGGANRTDDLLALRLAMARGDWGTTARMLASTSAPDRLAPLLVIDEAGRRAQARDLSGARAALDVVRAQGGFDAVVWYRLGESYELADSPDDAVQAYTRGAAIDPTAPWTKGRYRIAMIEQREQRWPSLVDLLAPLAGAASDEDSERAVDPLQVGGAVWQEAFLALGQAYDHLGRNAEAEATYDRIARIAAPRRDWTLNRALFFLSRAKRSHGDFASALDDLGRALDLATEFDVSYRRQYELDTAAEVDRLIDQARRDGQLGLVRSSADDLAQRLPQSAGAWFLRGRVHEAQCDLDGARSAYQRAAGLLRAGAGAFLAGRPADPATVPCPPK